MRIKLVVAGRRKDRLNADLLRQYVNLRSTTHCPGDRFLYALVVHPPPRPEDPTALD